MSGDGEKDESKKVTLEDVFDDVWRARTVDELVSVTSTAERFKVVYEFMADALKSAIGGPDSVGGPVDPAIATAVLLELEVRVAEIDEVVTTSKAIGLSLPTVQEVLGQRKVALEQRAKDRVERFRKICVESGFDPDTGKPLESPSPPEPPPPPNEGKVPGKVPGKASGKRAPKE